MKEYITIKNFGPIRNIENMPVRQFTILIGESAIGKSTLMKIVSMVRYLFKMANIRSYLKNSNITSSPFHLRLGTMMERQGMSKMMTSDSLIDYKVVMDDGEEYHIGIEKKELKRLPTIAPQHLIFSKISFISENRNIIPTWAQRAYQNKGATLGFYFHETNTDFVRASENDKVVELGYIGMKLQITHPKGKPTKLMIVPDDNRHNPIELREASSGIQTSASVSLIVKNFSADYSFKDAFKRSVLNYLFDTDRLTKFNAVIEPDRLINKVYIHIEEPELSLFPNTQCKLIEELFLSASHANTDRDINLMLATHSPYILNYLNVMLNQTDDTRAKLSNGNTAVYRIYDGEAQDLLMQDENGRWIVDTYDLSEMMNTIYREFIALGV